MRKTLQKLRNKHFLALLGNSVIALFGFITSGLLYRFLSRPDAGKWFVFLTILSLCDAIRNGFLGTATVKFYAGTERRRAAAVMGSVWFLAFAITALVMAINAIALAALPYIHDDGLILSIKWLGLTFLSTLPFSVIYWKLQADEAYGNMLWLKLVNSVSTPLSFILLFALGKLTLESVIIFNFITNCLTSLVGLLSGLGRIRSFFYRSKESILEIFHFGKHSMGTTLSANLLSSTDTFIIRIFLGPAAVAIYNVPRQLMQFVDMILRTFVGTGMSGMAIAFNQKNMEHVTYIMKKYTGMLIIAFIPLVIVALLFAGVGIGIMSGGKYAGTEAADLFRLFMIFSLLSPIDRFNGATLDIIHKPKINLYKVLLMLVLSICSDTIGLYLFHNLYAVAFAGLFTMICGNIFGYYHLKKYMSYTIPGIFSSGVLEMKNFVRNHIRLK